MQSQSRKEKKISFILKSKEELVPMRYGLIKNQQILESLLFDGLKYQFQSDISFDVFDSFIKYWITNEFPIADVTIENFEEFEILSDEIQIDEFSEHLYKIQKKLGESSINLHKIQSQKTQNNANIEEKISKNLDNYVINHGSDLFTLPIQSLYNIFNHKNRNLVDHNHAFKMILDHYNTKNDANILILLQFINFEKLNYNNQKDSIKLSNSHNLKIPNLNIINLIDKTNRQEKIINEQEINIDELKEINDIFQLFYENNDPEQILLNRQKIHKYLKNKFNRLYMDEMRQLILPKYELDNGIVVLLNLKNLTAEVIKSPNVVNDLIIPPCFIYQFQTFTINSIGRNHFWENKSIFGPIQMITIPESVIKLEKGWCQGICPHTTIFVSESNKYFKSIDKFVYGKTNKNSMEFDVLYFAKRDITEVKIPNNIKRIESFCFEQCKLLNKVELSDDSNFLEIGDFSFMETNIKYFYFPSKVVTIDEGAFGLCHNLEKIEFSPNSNLTSIGPVAFYKSKIEYIIIPEKVSELKERWCYGIKENTKITVEKSNQFFKSVDDKYIVGKTNNEYDVLYFVQRGIENFTIPNYIQKIETCCFSECNKLENIEISEDSKLKEIGKWAFYNLRIKSFSFPKKLEKIDSLAFCKCNYLQTIIFTSTIKLPSIEKNAFYNCPIKNINVPDNSFNTTNKDLCNYQYIDKKFIVRRTDNCEKYNILQFAQRNITDASIPDFIRQIKPCCFANCDLIKIIDLSKNKNIKEIEPYSFSSSSIEIIILPKQITKIRNHAFYECKKLKSIEISQESRLITIGNNSFDSTSIEKFIIPFNVIKIGNYAFANCKNLKNIVFNQNSKLISIGSCAFKNSPIEKIIINENVSMLNERWCEEIKAPTKVIVNESNPYFKNIDNKYIISKTNKNKDDYDDIIFVQRNIDDFTIPSNIRKIEPCCFSYCKFLYRIDMTKNIKISEISYGMFANSSLTCIDIPKYILNIAPNAFYNCKLLNKVHFQEDSKLRLIGYNAFHSTSIKSISIPSNVVEIGDCAFYSCNDLKIIEFQSNLKFYSLKESFQLFTNTTDFKIIMIPAGFKIK